MEILFVLLFLFGVLLFFAVAVGFVARVNLVALGLAFVFIVQLIKAMISL